MTENSEHNVEPLDEQVIIEDLPLLNQDIVRTSAPCHAGFSMRFTCSSGQYILTGSSIDKLRILSDDLDILDGVEVDEKKVKKTLTIRADEE